MTNKIEEPGDKYFRDLAYQANQGPQHLSTERTISLLRSVYYKGAAAGVQVGIDAVKELKEKTIDSTS